MGFIRIVKGLTEVRGSYIFDRPITRGTVIQETVADASKAAAADNDYRGILIQEVTEKGPDFAVQNAGIPVDEVPIKHAATVVSGDGEIVTNMTASGNEIGTLSTAAIGVNVGVFNGKWRQTQSGDKVFGVLREKDYGGITGRYRIEVFRTATVTA
jgi:hypothetical protein